MKLFRIIVFFALLSIIWANHAQAQFLNIQIDVEPEVETLVDRSFNFGQIVIGSGFNEVPLGAPGMGIFQIRALRTQRILISLESDQVLRHEDPDVEASIPIELSASYSNNGVEDYRTSVPFSSLTENIVLEGPPQNPTATWSSIFVYVYGGINIGNIPTGTYTGEVVLTVIYE